MNEHLLERRLNQVGARLLSFSCRESQAAALCDDLSLALAAGIRVSGAASLVLPGGTTPERLLELLADEAVDWSKVTVTLSDERWVDSDSRDSNERLLRERLFRGPAAAAHFVPLKSPHTESAEQDAALASLTLGAMPSFDRVVLGMGSDGHCASLFPDSPQLDAALDMASALPCMALETAASPYPRLSLTLPRLLNCSELVLQICGEEKRHVLERALYADHAAPVAALFGQNVPISVYWAP